MWGRPSRRSFRSSNYPAPTWRRFPHKKNSTHTCRSRKEYPVSVRLLAGGYITMCSMYSPVSTAVIHMCSFIP